MVTLASWRLRFPEFDRTSDARVNAALLDAALECHAGTYGTLYETAVGYLAAHLIASSVHGQAARRSAEAGKTTAYQTHFERLQTIAALGPRVF